MDSQPAYLIDKILPSRRIHLLAGISSAGKSRWIIPALLMYSHGLQFLGLKVRPVPWCVVCRDRPLADSEDMLRSMGFDSTDVNIIPAFGKHNKTRTQIFEAIEDCGAKLILWEGFDMMVKSPNNHHEVGEFLSEVSAYCEEGLTVIGTVGVAKLKPHERYDNPRQLVAGSSIWERATSSNFIIVSMNPRDISDGRRLLYVSLKNEPSFQLEGRFDENGLLTFDDWERRHQGAISAIAMGAKRNGSHG